MELYEEELITQEKLQDPESICRAKSLLSLDPNNHEKKFALGITLAVSAEEENKDEGIFILKELINEATDISLIADSHYFISVAQLRLGRLHKARKNCEILMRARPENTKAEMLHMLIKEKIRNQKKENDLRTGTRIGVAVGAVAAVAGIVSIALSKSKR